MRDLKGVIFNIQRFSLHDGAGIRTVVFLKGCSLACGWCANPESISGKIDILFDKNKCINCDLCVPVCPVDAIYFHEELGHYIIDRTLCTNCGLCAEVCPTEAVTSVGEYKRVSEVLERIKSDKPFFNHSGGGLTLSGGEILFQAPFAYQILKQSQAQGINTAIETSGNGRWDWLSKIATVTNTIHFDVKALDGDLHQTLTNVNNHHILENLQALDKQLGETPPESRSKLVLRIPLIEGKNTSDENIEETANFLKHNLSHYSHLELLPFHNFGGEKYRKLDRPYQYADKPNMDSDTYDVYLKKFQELGIKTQVMTW